jgi:hypothetical protein
MAKRDRSRTTYEAAEREQFKRVGSFVLQNYGDEAPQDLLTQNDYYLNCAEPLLRHLGLHKSILSSKPSLQGFYRAYSLVSSRAFLVDAYHGLSMVPVADALVV